MASDKYIDEFKDFGVDVTYSNTTTPPLTEKDLERAYKTLSSSSYEPDYFMINEKLKEAIEKDIYEDNFKEPIVVKGNPLATAFNRVTNNIPENIIAI